MTVSNDFRLSSPNSLEPINDNLTVKVKRAAGYNEFKAARFHISVGQPYHEGAMFASTMAWAAKNFDKVSICINDTLQRHNLIFEGKNPEEAFDIAHQAGTDWIQRNTEAIQHVMQNTDTYEGPRWEGWHKHEDFSSEMDKVRNLYEKDIGIKKAIDSEALSFWKRKQNQDGLTGAYEQARFLQHSVEYLKEECAIFSIMFREKPPAADVYPGGSLLPCRLFKPEEQKGGSIQGFTKIEFKPVGNIHNGAKANMQNGTKAAFFPESSSDKEIIVPESMRRNR